jgi:hypothetical protein
MKSSNVHLIKKDTVDEFTRTDWLSHGHQHSICLMTRLILLVPLALMLIGCPATQETHREEPPALPSTRAIPEITVRVGSLDLSRTPRRIETADVLNLASTLKRDSIDILAVQGIIRYPGVTTRVDFVDELAFQSGMRYQFGESVTLSNRQQGNAVFSNYPIQSSSNTSFPLTSAAFSAALQVVVDAGARDVVVISTLLPDRILPADEPSIASTFSSFNIFYNNRPIIIAGNLPRNSSIQTTGAFQAIEHPRDFTLPRIWYSGDGSLRPVQAEPVKTNLGDMVVVNFSVFRSAPK